MPFDSFVTLGGYAREEYTEKKSRFIASASPVKDTEQALAFVNRIKDEFPDARHNVYAYMLGTSNTRYSDDGEPSGTAGMPVLDVIRNGGFTDAVIVVTRYFGGTLLGTGGLVRAYTTAAAMAVQSAGIVGYCLYGVIRLTVSYGDYKKLSRLLFSPDIVTDATDFTDNVTMMLAVKKNQLDGFVRNVTELTSAKADVKLMGERFDREVLQ